MYLIYSILFCRNTTPTLKYNRIACVRGSPMVPLVGNICTIRTNLITNGTLGKELDANGKNGNLPLVPMVQMLPTNGTIGRTPNTRIVISFYKHVLVPT